MFDCLYKLCLYLEVIHILILYLNLNFIIVSGCDIVDKIPNGRLNVLNDGTTLEVVCDLGYTVNGPKFAYCNEDFEWNEELKGCKG